MGQPKAEPSNIILSRVRVKVGKKAVQAARQGDGQECGQVRDGICHSRHSRRECKIFASGVNFSRNNAVCFINESKTLHFTLISSQKLLTYY